MNEEMLKNLDFLLNMDILEHEKDWEFIDAVEDVKALEHEDETKEDAQESKKDSAEKEKDNE